MITVDFAIDQGYFSSAIDVYSRVFVGTDFTDGDRQLIEERVRKHSTYPGFKGNLGQDESGNVLADEVNVFIWGGAC
jgi:hypothetical protein